MLTWTVDVANRVINEFLTELGKSVENEIADCFNNLQNFKQRVNFIICCTTARLKNTTLEPKQDVYGKL